MGASFIQRMYESGGMKILTKASSMLGLMMMGSMTASNVKFKDHLRGERGRQQRSDENSRLP